MDIINFILKHPKSNHLIHQHGLGGLLFQTIQGEAKYEFENCYLQQWHLNQCYQQEYLRVQEIAKKEGIEFQGIKGISLIENVYSDLGMRKMSDIDILTDNFQKLSAVFENLGYLKLTFSKYKVVYSKLVDQNEIVFEIHGQLYPNENLIPECVNGILSHAEHFYFLIYHVSYQHTFIRLNWLVDLVHYQEKYPQDLNQIMMMARERGHENAFNITFYFLQIFFNFKVNHQKFPFQDCFDQNFLVNPYEKKILYFLLKHLTKKSFKDSIQYNLKWLLNKH